MRKKKEMFLKPAICFLLAVLIVFSAIPVFAAGNADAAVGGDEVAPPAHEPDDMRVWFDKPAKISGFSGYDWANDALLIGNGYMGGIVFGGVEKDRIHFNEKTIWDGGPSTSRPNYNGGNLSEENAVTPEFLEEFRQKLDDKSKDVFGLKFGSESNNYLNQLMGDLSGFNAYKDFGDIYLDFAAQGTDHSNYSNYMRELDMSTGVSTVYYEVNGTRFKREYFNSYPDNVLVMKLDSSEAGQYSFDASLSFFSPYNLNVSAVGDTITATGELRDNQLRYETQMKIIPVGGNMTANDNGTISVENADSVTLVFACGTNYKNEYPTYRGEDPHEAISGRISAAAAKGYDTLKTRHVDDHSALFSRVELDLNSPGSMLPTNEVMDAYKKDDSDKFAEVLIYQFGRYLTIAGSREGALPTNLQGVWGINSFSWYGDYHFNINLEMNYWPTMSTNLAECMLPLNEYVDSLRVPGRVNAERSCTIASTETEHNGWLVHCFSNPFGYTANNKGNQEAGWNPSGSAWILQNVYDYYRYTGDEQYLRDTIYPMMKEVATFWTKFLWWSPNQQRMTVAPSVSAENGPTAIGTTYDQSLVWQLFEETIQASEVLGVDADEREEWKRLQSQLKPIMIGDDGQIKEWYEETTFGRAQDGDLPEIDIPNWRSSLGAGDVPHRHTSHLIGLFPGTLINKDKPEYMDAAIVSLNERGTGATGWARANKICNWARTLDGNQAYELVKSMAKGGNAGILNSLMCSHGSGNNYEERPIFQIDGNFGTTAGMTEMLLQSQLGYTQFLPAIPDAWDTGSVKGLVARGNFIVDMQWSEGSGDKFTVTSRNGGRFIGEYAGLAGAQITAQDGSPVEVTKDGADKVSFDTVAGKTYEFRLNAKPDKLNTVITQAKEFMNGMAGENLDVPKSVLSAAIGHAEQVVKEGAVDYTDEVQALTAAIDTAKGAVRLDGTVAEAKEFLKTMTIGDQEWEYTQAEHEAFAAQIDDCIAGLNNAASGKDAYDALHYALAAEQKTLQGRRDLMYVSFARSGADLTMSSVYPNLEIRYTLDGSEPTAFSNLYAEPFSLPGSVTVKANVCWNGEVLGSVKEYNYTAASAAEQATSAVASNVYSSYYGGDMAVDGDRTTRWATKNGTTEATLELTFAEPISFNMANIYSYVSSTNSITSFKIEYWKDEAWKTAYEYNGEKIPEDFDASFDKVTSDKVRLNLLSAQNPSIYEFGLYTSMEKLDSNKILLEKQVALGQAAIDRGVMQAPGQPNESDDQKRFSFSMRYAQAVLANVFADQATVDDAASSLSGTLSDLGLLKGDKTQLQSVYDGAASLTLTDYDDPQKVAIFKQKLGEADALLKDEGALQTEVDKALAGLTEARDNMLATLKDWTALDAALAVAAGVQEGIDNNEYYELNVEAFETAYTAAKAVKADVNSRQQAISDAAAALLEAIDGLVAVDPSVDKAALAKTIALGQLSYERNVLASMTAGEQERFNTAFTSAKTAMYDPRATQAAVNAAQAALNETITALNLGLADKSGLQEAYDEAAGLTLTDYDSAEKAAAFKQARDKAKALLSDENTLQREADGLVPELRAAQSAMVATKKDRSILETTIAGAEQKLSDVESGKYVEVDVRRFQNALSMAKTVLNTPESSQSEIDAAVDRINSATANLRLAANKEALKKLIERVEKMDLSGYTANRVEALRAALDAAKDVLNDPTLSTDEQGMVDRAAETLQKAVDELSVPDDVVRLRPDVDKGSNTANSQQIIERMKEAGEGATMEITLVSEGGKAPAIKADVFQAARAQAAEGKLKNLRIVLVDTVGQQIGTITFEAGKISAEWSQDFRPGISFEAADELQKAVKGQLRAGAKTMFLTFEHDGAFPAPAAVSVRTDANTFKAGDRIYLHYHDGQTLKRLTEAFAVDGNGYANFQIEHASTYVLSDKILLKDTGVGGTGSGSTTGGTKPKTGDEKDMTIFIIIACAAAGMIGYLAVRNARKKRQYKQG